MNADYQWPSPDLKYMVDFVEKSDHEMESKLTTDIQDFFKKKLNSNVILMPSGRSALSLILKYYKVNRSHSVFSPKWSSHCVWDIITRYSNPESETPSVSDYALMVHKWGAIDLLSEKSNCVCIEDSVDSVFVNGSSLFPNNGDFEIISLPKIIGSYTGGLLVCKSSKLLEEISEIKGNDLSLAKYQSRLRHNYALNFDNGFAEWGHNEVGNNCLDYNGLSNIYKCLANYSLNEEIILSRLDYIKGNSDNIVDFNEDRLPPVFSVDIQTVSKPITSDIMVRTKSYSGLIDKPNFKKVALIPLHFGASDEFFLNCFKLLCKN